MRLPQDLRKNLLAKIHIARKQLGMGEDAYRDFLEGVTGQRSAKDLDARGLKAVMDGLVALGFKPGSPPTPLKKGGATGKLSPMTREKPELEKTQVDKIRALWIEGYKAGVIKNRYESGLNKFVKRMFKVERVEWLDWAQSQKAIEAIKAMIKRKEEGSDA